jgi:hypothetical protein
VNKSLAAVRILRDSSSPPFTKKLILKKIHSFLQPHTSERTTLIMTNHAHSHLLDRNGRVCCTQQLLEELPSEQQAAIEIEGLEATLVE